MPLALFAPPIRDWFAERLGAPTEIQTLAWPRIAAGRHVLVTAPTGSGKTLTAFLWALNQLATGALPTGRTAVLYVSPLRALGNDIQRNLLGPLAELPPYFARFRLELPPIRVLTRSGDTPPEARARMRRQPPEILVTTPESLNILLTSGSGRQMLATVATVILDEVHAVAASKRGAHLMTAVERLALLAGEVQRIALSATVRPPEVIARWVGGHRLEGRGAHATHHPRPVEVVAATTPRRLELEVDVPPATMAPGADRDLFWKGLTARLKRRIRRNRTTLVFANSRRMVEKVARFVNEDEAELLAWSHHGSLAREVRAVVEERLKAGSLKAVVATSSLELGIDIGEVDEVLAVQAPPTVASMVQRLGRSGHGVGQTSRGRLYPVHRRGLVDCAVIARAALDGDLEPLAPVGGALDVLAQVVLSMTVSETWPLDDLYAAVRCADAYHRLPRHHFDLVLAMLSGRYASTRLRALKPLVSIDAVARTVRARPGAERLLYSAGGTIPDRGYFQLKLEGAGSPIGQLDEEFVWERSVGDTFTLGVQTWRVASISHNDVFVAPARAASAMAPFWRAEEQDRSAFVGERVGRFLEWAAPRLAAGSLEAELRREWPLTRAAAAELNRLLAEQVAASGALPHRHQVVEEHTAGSRGRDGERQVVLHTLWGGAVNRPLAHALAAAWEARHGQAPTILHDDDCLVVTHPATIECRDLLGLVRPERLAETLQRRLEHTGFFGARFREAAGCALLLPRSGHGRRTPLWLHRQRAKELLEAVRGADDFPVVLEAWRACLQDHFDLTALARLLGEVHDGTIAVQQVRTDSPSPFAAHVLWKQTNELMYEGDAPLPGAGAGLRADLVREVALSPHLRPRLDPALVAALEAKLQRLAPGYAPRTPEDLVDWVAERLAIPAGEWEALPAAMARDHGLEPAEVEAAVAARVVRLRRPAPLVVALEMVPLVAAGLDLAEPDLVTLDGGELPAARRSELASLGAGEPLGLDGFLGQWLAGYGPRPLTWVATALGIAPPALAAAVDALAAEQVVVVDLLTADAVAPEVCDRDNLERLLRLARREQRPAFAPLELDQLPLFLACHQGLGTSEATPDDLQRVLEPLLGYPAPAALWESDLLPARLEPYLPAWLDALLADTDLRWLGCGERRLAFALEADRDLVADGEPAANDEGGDDGDDLLPASGRYLFHELLGGSGRDSAALGEALWRQAWQGRASADSFAPVRRGLASGFTVTSAAAAGGSRRGRGSFDRWRSQSPLAGRWFRLAAPPPVDDLLAAAELERDRARLVLERYGVVFRQLLEREPPALRWGRLFRALRLLELGGEIVSGCFVAGLPGLQFASHAALRRIRDGLPADHVWWLNAADPASPCGLGLDGLDPRLPSRLASSHLVFHGRQLVLVAERSGRRLDVAVAPDHPELERYLAVLAVLITRDAQPKRSLEVTEINGEAAAASPYRAALERRFHVTRGHGTLRLARRY